MSNCLDFVSGNGEGVEILNTYGIYSERYIKYHYPESPSIKVHSIICFYVLNNLLSVKRTCFLTDLFQLVLTGIEYCGRRDFKNELIKLIRKRSIDAMCY